MRVPLTIVSSTTLAILCAWASVAGAKPRLELSVTPEAGATNILLEVTNDAGERPDVLGFHVYRFEFDPDPASHGACLASVRVTDEPLLRPFGTSEYSFQVQDGELAQGRVFQYWLEGHPTIRVGQSWSFGFDHEASRVALSTGRALFAVRTWVEQSSGEYYFNSYCCIAFTDRLVEVPEAILGNGYWKLYGTLRPRSDFYRYEWVVEAVEPDLKCADFAVEDATWATVKSLFR